MTDKQLPDEPSVPQFMSRRERREYERARQDTTPGAGDQYPEPSEADAALTADVTQPERPEENPTPQPLAADGPGGLQDIPQRPKKYSEPTKDSNQEAERQAPENGLSALPEDTRDYPDLPIADPQDLNGETVDDNAEVNPLGYMLVANGNADLPEIDEEELKTRKIRKRRRTIVMLTSFAVFLGLLAIVGIGVGQLVGWNNKDYPGPGGQELAFEVNPGEGAIIIGNRLVVEDIVASTRAFRDAVEAAGTSAEIQPGEYTLRYQMPAREAAKVLLRVGVPGQNYVHVNSGHRVDDVYENIAEQTRYDIEEIEDAADPANFDLPDDATTLEGYIAVGEYHFPMDASIEEILTEMIEPTMDEFERLEITDEEKQHRLVTIASIVEAEALPEDYALVAGIIENRLDSTNEQTNGYLQIDATVIYGLGIRQLQFTAEDRQDASNEYNTYAHPGLPPGPIGAPSIAALDAAAEPEDSDYYYWITTNIETGETKFSTTYEQHSEYQQEYRAYCDDNPDICGRD